MAPKPRRRGTIVPPSGKPNDRRKGWLVRILLPPDPATGKRERLNKTLPSRREAEAYLTAELARMDQGHVPAAGKWARLTLRAWLDEWAELWSGHLSPESRAESLDLLRRYLPDGLKDQPLKDLAASQIQRLLLDLSGRGLAPRTVHAFYRSLKARLSDAEHQRRLATNPMTKRVKPPKLPRRAYRTLTAAEAAELVSLAEGEPFGALWVLLLLSGMRPSEALALRWEDVWGGRVNIRRSLKLKRSGAGARFGETKTERVRALQLDPLARRFLERHRKAQAEIRDLPGWEYRDQGLVFASPSGDPLDWRNLYRHGFRPMIGRLALKLTGQDPSAPAGKGSRSASQAYRARVEAALVKTGLDAPGVRLRAYDLRHTAATLLLEAEEHPKVVQEILGHATIAMTLDTYSHVSPELTERAMSKLSALVQSGRERRLRAVR